MKGLTLSEQMDLLFPHLIKDLSTSNPLIQRGLVALCPYCGKHLETTDTGLLAMRLNLAAQNSRL